MILSLPAFAKVNLDLRVLGVRADGYHDLRTIFQSLALADTVTVRLRPGSFEIQCDAPGVPTDRRNLVWKAASLLWRTAQRRRGEPRDLCVTLDKRIPAEAGLGGGSADAAVTLIALNRLWKLGLDGAALARIGARLGADVPFFLVGGTALGLGRGDDIYPLADLPKVYVVLIKPGFGVATVEAYRWFDEEPRRPRREPVGRRQPPGWPDWAAVLCNDLETPVVRHHPTIGRIRQALLDAGAVRAAMSGSGSAVYGLFERADAARRTARDLARPGWTVLATRTLNRAEYQRLGRYHAAAPPKPVASAGETRIR
ncbi:MAG TPA: 4-(cytidine 5'-diphospho)-2-C-methyl-D-erythritol kinase [Vicinamibacterales bacterium]|nr:4-(cytidine 5'-diphospho)-2-C-methyl-D-erythritol kinase [Vicinamibacterales bacterium]